jgi:hypothetical protein
MWNLYEDIVHILSVTHANFTSMCGARKFRASVRKYETQFVPHTLFTQVMQFL